MQIFEVLPKIISKIGVIEKNRKADAVNYRFRGVDDIYSALNRLLAEFGVTIVPTVTNKEYSEYTTEKGKLAHRITMDVEYNIYASDGSSISCRVSSEAHDTSDKATPKALSMAYKYMAIQVFCIPTEEKMDTEYEEIQLESSIEFRALTESLDSTSDFDKWYSDNKSAIDSLSENEKEKLRAFAKQKNAKKS